MRNKQKGKGRKIANRFSDWPPPPKELVLAGGRIGYTSAKRLKWLLAFAAFDLNALSQGQLSDLVWEIKAFLFPPDIQNVVQKRSNDGHRSLLVQVEEEISVEDFQTFVKSGIESAFHGGWKFNYPTKTETVGLISKEGEVTMLQFDIISVTQAFETAVFDLVKAERERLGLCANQRCRKPFVTEKKYKGKFCSPRCSAYVRRPRRYC